MIIIDNKKAPDFGRYGALMKSQSKEIQHV